MKVSTVNPYSEKLLSTYKYLSDQEVLDKINSSQNAFIIWKNNNFKYKNKLLRNLSKNLLTHINKYALLITNEMGKPISESIAEIKKCSFLCDYYLSNSEEHLKTSMIDLDNQIAEIRNEPLGIILGIMPWNFPFWQVFRFAVPAIMAGNTIMIKHAPNTFGCGELIKKIFVDSGYPNHIFSSLVVDHSQIENIIANKNIQAVSLTGSDKAGSAVGAIAGKYIKKTLFELGGSDPFIVFSDAKISEAVNDAMAAKFLNCGQSCISPKRFFIHKDISDEFISKLVKNIKKIKIGNPENSETNIGPLSKKEFVDKINNQVDKSIEMGAKVIYRFNYNSSKGYFLNPIVLNFNSLDIPIFKEEIFGPVIPIYIFNDKDNIIALANKTEFGLGASIWTLNEQIMNEFKKNINVGALFINGMTKSDPRIPFGGIKKSGYGRELSIEGIKEFVNIKTVVMNKEEYLNV